MPLNIAMLAEKIDGTGLGKYLIFLFAIYFVIKWAVREGIKEAYEEIKDTPTDCKEYKE